MTTATPAIDPRQALVDEIAALDAAFAGGQAERDEAERAAQTQLDVAREELRTAQERAGRVAGEAHSRWRQHEAERNELLAQLRRLASPAIDAFGEELVRLEQWGVRLSHDPVATRAAIVTAQRALPELRELPLDDAAVVARIVHLRRAIPVDGIPLATLATIRRPVE
jgi:hypothetical protein